MNDMGVGESWQATVDLPSAEAARIVEGALDGIVEQLGATLSTFEIDRGPRWRITLHCVREPDRAALDACIGAAAVAAGVASPALAIERLDPADWVAEYRRRAVALRVERFFIHPSHHTGGLPQDALPILLDAGLAFGTGGHESTRGCLNAFCRLADWGTAPDRALDMGCGSGILAIAIAKLWPRAAVTACDNDPVAVAVAQENLAANGVAARVTTGVGEGYAAAVLRDAPPFDLVAANILADPLRAMASDLARRLAPGGRAVLSGILASQADEVLDAHIAEGLTLVQRIDLGEWTTLIVGRDGG